MQATNRTRYPRRLDPERKQTLPVVQHAAGNDSRNERALRKEEWAKGIGDSAQKADAPGAIGVSGSQTKIEARDMPQKAEPYQQSHVPAKQNELKDRNTDEGIPVAGWGEIQVSRTWRGVPGGSMRCRLAAPDPATHGVDKGEQQQFYPDRVAHAQCRLRSSIVGRTVFGWDDSTIEELPDEWANVGVNLKLGNQERRQRDQESDMSLHIAKERDADAVADSATIDHRQDEKRQPCDEGDDQNAAPLQLQRIAGEMGSAVHLKQRATQNQREVRPLRTGLGGFHVLSAVWRRGWDSNPRYLAVNTLSKRAPSATRPPLQRNQQFTRTSSRKSTHV